MIPLLDDLRARLEALRRDGLYRQPRLPAGIDFASNDYLGLSAHPLLCEGLRRALEDGPVGAPASRLLRGHTREHAALEARLARFKGTEAALLFPSGWQANAALLSTLVKSDDLAVTDERNHASIVDGLRSSGCRTAVVPHVDPDAVEAALRDRPARGRAFVIVESLFSMDGDAAPLDRYAEICEAHDAHLIVDDAHATGLYGERGSGLAEHFGVERKALAIVSTCGKALGLAGAFVAGPAVLIEYLVNRARPFIFSTAIPPVLVRAIGLALDLVESEPWRRRRVLELAARLRSALAGGGADCLRSSGPIVPVVLGANERAVTVAERLAERGFDVRAVRPPAVPPRTARLRISVHADHEPETIDALAAALVDAVGPETSQP